MNVGNPAGYAAVVVPSDVTIFDSPTRALYIGTAGNIAVRMFHGQNTLTILGVVAGILPLRVDKVMATGTTAAQITALW
jgi:hypothetical protein